MHFPHPATGREFWGWQITESWQQAVVKRLSLEHTPRPQGRPERLELERGDVR